MAINAEWLKAHWYYIAAGLVGVFVLYEVVSSLNASSSTSSTTDVSGGANALQTYTAAADLQNAQVNGQVEIASIAGGVANTQTEAALQLGEVQTAAELDATNHQTAAAVAVNQANDTTAEQIQKTVTAGQVQQTQIEGDTIDTLGAQKEAVSLAITKNVGTQISNIQAYSKNAAKDYGAIAPVLAEETGQGGSVGAAKPAPGSTTAQNIAAASSGIGTILSGLFA